MSERVDVLAVMDRCANAVEAYSTKIVLREAGFVSECSDGGLREARAAVAELVEAVKKGRDYPIAGEHSDAIIFTGADADALRAAISNFGSEP